jgi:diguanylate cyclase (GGDEF)-like protein
VAELDASAQTLSVSALRSAPLDPDITAPGAEAAVEAGIRRDEESILGGLSPRAQAGVPPSLLAAGRADLAALEPIEASVLAIFKRGVAAAARDPEVIAALQVQLYDRATALSGVLAAIGRTDATRAGRARVEAVVGAAAAMLLLLSAFAFFYLRSVAAGQALKGLLLTKGAEARTDPLTGLGNRRALSTALVSATAQPPGGREFLLVMFDLDGFKQYNDSFGHTAGDALLQRLGARLAEAAAAHSGAAYRMGGDEFWMLTQTPPEMAEGLLVRAVAALQETGEGWHVGCTQGAAWIPSEANTETAALKLADDRMYASKAGRSSPSRQVTDALLQVITEQNLLQDDHVERVSRLAGELAEAFRLPEHEVARIRLAARLHDIGKAAIPAAILNKPGPLDEREWEFMRRHPMIGERIALAAPALAGSAPLIRSSHERIDGAGYPDRLAGADIPLGSRIIAVCDAFDAMTSERPYRGPTGIDDARAELKRLAGAQFDTNVVEAFCRLTAPEQPSAEQSQAMAAAR